MQIDFTADIEPQPQGSSSALIFPVKGSTRCHACKKPHKQRAAVFSANPELKAYRSAITNSARNVMFDVDIDEPMAGKHIPVELELQFQFVKPESVSASRTEMIVRPDLDKLCRSTLDAMTGVVYLDDAQVVKITTSKVYGTKNQVRVSARTLTPATLFEGR